MSTTLERPVVTKEGVQALIDEIDCRIEAARMFRPDDTDSVNRLLDQRFEYMQVRDRL